MIDQDLVKRNLVGRDGFTWWIGQIPSSKVWKMNTPGMKVKSNDDIKGFDYRYKVRIMGYHTANVNDLKDEELPWAGVMYPITAGVSGGAVDTPQIMQGNFVYGFFLDGSDAQMPVIMGIIGYNQYTKILKNVPDTPFKPFSSYAPSSNKNSEFVGTDQIGGYKGVKSATVATLKNPYVPPKDRGGQGGNDPNGPDINSEGIIGDSSVATEQITSGADVEQEKNRSKPKNLPTNSRCEPSPTSAIQREMKNLLNDVQRIKKTANDWETKVSTRIDSIEHEIQKATNRATKEITGNVKRIVDGIQRNVNKKVNRALTKTYHLSLPSKRPALAKEIAKATDGMGCLFKNLMENLSGMVGGFIDDILDRFINAPTCAAEDFLGGLLGNITGILDSQIANILNPIKNITQSLGQAIDIGEDLVGFATDALTILDCKPDPKCTDAKEWSPGQGPVIIAKLDVNSIIEKAKGISSSIQEAAGQLSGAIGGLKSLKDQITDAASGLKDLAKNPLSAVTGSCDTGPKFCGPPTIDFSGGGGSGAIGNAIVSTATAILGVDLTLPGSGYVSPPRIRFNDDCGKGKGASGRAVLGPVKKVVNKTIIGNLTANSDQITNVSNTDGIVIGSAVEIDGDNTVNNSEGDGTITLPDGAKIRSIDTNTGTLTINKVAMGSGSTTGTVFSIYESGNVEYEKDNSVTKNEDGTYPEGTNLGVVSVIMEQTGSGYLPFPDGSQGGDGTTYAKPDDTIIKRADGTYHDTPYQPGTVVEVFQGDQVTKPGGIIENILEDGIITTQPQGDQIVPRGQDPSLNDGSYPVLLEIGDVAISEPGLGYDPKYDTVVIEPSNGAEVRIKTDELGSIIETEVINGGFGFTDEPEIYIQSNSGYNARLVPVFIVNREGIDAGFIPENNMSVIQVVDCVGKVSHLGRS